MFELQQTGSTFRAINRWNLVASRDAWQAPVQVKVGPDGAVWVSDFYSLVAQHNPTPEGMELGKGNAYETPNRDKIHGRIYRIVAENAPNARTTRLDNATPQQLVAALRDDNLFWRQTAQRLLVERGQLDVLPALIEMARDPTVDELGLNPGALHALWTLDGLAAIEDYPALLEVALRALHHPAASIRRAALVILPRDTRLLEEIFRAGMLPERASPHAVDYTVGSGLLQDADAQVRLNALLALSEMPASPRAAAAITAVLSVPQNGRDPWIPEAAAIAGAKQGPDVALGLLGADPAARDTAYLTGMRNAVRLMTHGFSAQRNTAAVVALLEAIPAADPIIAAGVFTGIVGEAPDAEGRQRGGPGGWPEEEAPTLTAEQRASLAAAARAAGPPFANGFARVASRWGMPDLFATR
jgi:hypothetical protein